MNLINKPDCTFQFRTIDTVEIVSIINSFKLKSSRGFDDLSNKLIKYIKDAIVEPLEMHLNIASHKQTPKYAFKRCLRNIDISDRIVID